jgi:hypothetical protein
VNIPIYQGSSSFSPGLTPFGFYDNDYQFQTDADKVSTFCARRLGYPLVDVELQDLNFYTAFEEAITLYGNEVYAYLVRENYLSLEGSPTTTPSNNQLLTPNLAGVVRLAEQYGVEAGVGGNVTYYTGSIDLIAGSQNYDLNAWAQASASIATTDSIEVKRIFYESTPAVMKYYDPYASTGQGTLNMLDAFGWSGYSPAMSFLLMPINYDLLNMQAIEFNDTIRKSNYSFELVNNQLRLFPIPNGVVPKLHFHYIKKSERNNPYQNGVNLITNVSEVPFTNPTYTQINSVGRQWIFEMTLAICKEILGYIRGKYGTVPIPGQDVTLNQQDLIAAATDEKAKLIENLRRYLDETSRKNLMERKKDESEFLRQELNNIPYNIFIG